MKYVLDTNAVSALMRGDAEVVGKLRGVPRSEVAVPQPVLAEIEYGIERLPRSARRERLRGRFDLIKAEVQRIEWTDEVSEAFGSIKALLERKGQRLEDFDAAVAAHAVAAGAVLVTANVKHMVRVSGLRLEDWSEPTRK
jgi:tRNA(fMet)-specific endonuclease VapC